MDLNGDGIADNEQPEVIKCIESSDGHTTICICKVSDAITAIEAVETIDPSTVSDNTNRPSSLFFGLFSYRIRVDQSGATVIVRMYFSENISTSTSYYKYDTVNGWQDYSQHTTFDNDGRSLTVQVKDGGYGDSDGVANGVIVDPGGVAASISGVDSGGTDSGDGSIEETGSDGANAGQTGGTDAGSSPGGCFITAATSWVSESWAGPSGLAASHNPGAQLIVLILLVVGIGSVLVVPVSGQNRMRGGRLRRCTSLDVPIQLKPTTPSVPI